MSRSAWCVGVVFLVLFVGAARLRGAESTSSEKWDKAIHEFEAADKQSPPAPGSVLFIGASSIRLWSSLAQDFSDYSVIRRGFGGSQIIDSANFADRIVIPYKPSAIILHAGGNDIAAGKSPEEAFADYRKFVDNVRAALPETPIAFLSVNPTPARWGQADKQRELNRLVKEYAASHKGLGFIDIWDALLDADGQPRPELHIPDRLHPNAEGYKIRAKFIHKYLESQHIPKKN